MTTWVLDAQGLGYRHGPQGGVEGLDLQLARGQVLGLLGLNGSGKSTALRLLSGTLRADSGRVHIDGICSARRPLEARRRLGFLPQRAPLYQDLTVDEQLRLAGGLHGLRGTQLRQAVKAALERFGLGAARSRLVGVLSQGYRQRLGIAQTVLHHPAVVLLDEPTVGLDPAHVHDLRALIRDLGRDSAVVLASHLLPEVEAVCSDVAVVHRGCLIHRQALNGRATAGPVLRLRLQRSPTLETLASLPGVARVEPLGSGEFVLQLDGAEAADGIVARAAEQGWGVRELAPHAERLEALFLRLTRGEASEGPGP